MKSKVKKENILSYLDNLVLRIGDVFPSNSIYFWHMIHKALQ